jgi:hypothetical protein
MSTANRAFNKFYKEEKDGHHEMTYLLWDAIDTMVSGNLESEDQVEVINKEIEKRMIWIMDQGVIQARKEMALIGISVIAVGVSSYCIGKVIKKIANNKKLRNDKAESLT